MNVRTGGRGGHMNTYQGGNLSGKIIPIKRHYTSLICRIIFPSRFRHPDKHPYETSKPWIEIITRNMSSNIIQKSISYK